VDSRCIVHRSTARGAARPRSTPTINGMTPTTSTHPWIVATIEPAEPIAVGAANDCLTAWLQAAQATRAALLAGPSAVQLTVGEGGATLNPARTADGLVDELALTSLLVDVVQTATADAIAAAIVGR
jgi:hypothetical protein